MDRPTVLIVDPDVHIAASLKASLEGVADTETCLDFTAARRRLIDHPPDLLVSNLRLDAYNGLHLVHLASGAGLRTRSVLYTDRQDAVLANEARAAGAFMEPLSRLAAALPAYANADLPHADRRSGSDRRGTSRGGGRRAVDPPQAN
jgi:DNA-binding NtrC family response regulator